MSIVACGDRLPASDFYSVVVSPCFKFRNGGLFGVYYNEGTFGGRRSLRTSDETLESEDEAIHFRWTQRYLHHRSPEDTPPFQRSYTVCCRTNIPRKNSSLCRNQAPGTRCNC